MVQVTKVILIYLKINYFLWQSNYYFLMLILIRQKKTKNNNQQEKYRPHHFLVEFSITQKKIVFKKFESLFESKCECIFEFMGKCIKNKSEIIFVWTLFEKLKVYFYKPKRNMVICADAF